MPTRKNGSLWSEEELHNSYYSWMTLLKRMCYALHKDGEKRRLWVMIGARGVWKSHPHARRVPLVSWMSIFMIPILPHHQPKIIINK
jgi:hypothetical protein